MSIRVDTTPLITGAVVVGVPGLGVLGSLVPATGEHGPGYAYDDLIAGDETREIRGLITTWPTNGTLTAFEDTSFEYDGTSDTISYQLYVDGVARGSVVTHTITIGTTSAALLLVESRTNAALAGSTPTRGAVTATETRASTTVSARAPTRAAILATEKRAASTVQASQTATGIVTTTERRCSAHFAARIPTRHAITAAERRAAGYVQADQTAIGIVTPVERRASAQVVARSSTRHTVSVQESRVVGVLQGRAPRRGVVVASEARHQPTTIGNIPQPGAASIEAAERRAAAQLLARCPRRYSLAVAERAAFCRVVATPSGLMPVEASWRRVLAAQNAARHIVVPAPNRTLRF